MKREYVEIKAKWYLEGYDVSNLFGTVTIPFNEPVEIEVLSPVGSAILLSKPTLVRRVDWGDGDFIEYKISVTGCRIQSEPVYVTGDQKPAYFRTAYIQANVTETRRYKW